MRQRKRRWGFEQLENRRLLAVTVLTSTSGDLLITGDVAADSITITEDTTGTQWQIAGSVGTLVNGSTSLTILKPTVQDVIILLDGGADSLTMLGINQGTGANAVTYVGQTTIDMDSEADTVNLGNFVTPTTGNFNFIPGIPAGPMGVPAAIPAVVGSNANDFIGAVLVDVGGGASATIATDATNSVTILNTDFGRAATTTPPLALIGGQLTILGSSGADTITIRGSNAFGGSFDIDTGAGADVVNIGQNTAPAGTDLNTTFARDAVTLGGNLDVNTGDGNDTITLERALTVGNITVHGGAGDDTIRLGSVTSTALANRVGSSTQGDLVVQGGDGNDAVTVNQATTVNSFLVGLGGGAAVGAGNTLVLQNSSFGNDASILGGDEADSLDIDAINIDTNLYIQTGGGNDNVDIQGTLVTAGGLAISTGDGDDDIRVDNSTIVILGIFAGNGNDDVELTANLIDDLIVDLGPGNDTFSGESTYRNQALVRGGEGNNTGEGSNFTAANFFFEDFANQGTT